MRVEKIATRAVVMTSDETPQTVARAVREQAYHYLAKPVQIDPLPQPVSHAPSGPPGPPAPRRVFAA